MNLNLWVVDEVEEEDEHVFNCSAKKKISCRSMSRGKSVNNHPYLLKIYSLFTNMWDPFINGVCTGAHKIKVCMIGCPFISLSLYIYIFNYLIV
jgi:hypothetical protein